jgi:hydrogenase maturation factor
MQIKEDSRLLFLRYALPCSNDLINNRLATQEQIDSLMKFVLEDRLPEEGAERIFKAGFAMCTIIAMKSDKKEIDADVIRQYFLMEHNKAVDEQFKNRQDFNPVECKTYAGKVLKVDADSALVSTPIGLKRCRTDFARGLKEGDNVAVHSGFAVERISDSIASRMNEIRAADLASHKDNGAKSARTRVVN